MSLVTRKTLSHGTVRVSFSPAWHDRHFTSLEDKKKVPCFSFKHPFVEDMIAMALQFFERVPHGIVGIRQQIHDGSNRSKWNKTSSAL